MQTWCRCDAQGGRVTQRCHNSPHWKWGYGVRVTSRTGSARRIWGISKKVREFKTRRRTRRFNFWGSLRRDKFARRGGRTRLGPDEEASIKRLCLSPYVETFNSKVIKRFRTWTKKSLRVFEFPDSCVLRYVYMLPTFDVHFTYFAHGVNCGYVTPRLPELLGIIIYRQKFECTKLDFGLFL